MESFSTKDIVGEIVAKNYKTAKIFKDNHIDYFCNGKRTIADACASQNIDEAKIIEELNRVQSTENSTATDYNSWPIDLLADYVEKKHHRYVEEKIPEIQPLIHKIVSVHGNRHPELEKIAELFKETSGELTKHMKKEELMLFPYIKNLVKAKENGTIPSSPFGTVANPIQQMMHEHDSEGERFRQIAQLADNYTPPSDACNTYRVTFQLLKEFEEDLHLHIHLENNILFPKAMQLENELQ